MPKSAGTITINLNAGTAEFILNLTKAGGAVKDFGTKTSRALGEASASATSSMMASSAAIRTLEGNITNNIRATERFLTDVLKIGPALQAAFPLVGAIAFGGMLFEMGKHVYEFFRTLEQAPMKTAAAFRELYAPLQTANDQLAITKDRLEEELAKLQGRPENGLALALDQARAAADALAVSLDNDLKKMEEVFRKQDIGWFRKLRGEAGTSDIADDLIKFREEIGDINDRGKDAMKEAGKNKALAGDQQGEWRSELTTTLADKVAAVSKELARAERSTRIFKGLEQAPFLPSQGYKTGETDPNKVYKDETERVRALKEELRDLKAMTDQSGTTFDVLGVGGLQGDVDEAKAKKSSEKWGRPFDEEMSKLNARAKAAQASLAAVGKDDMGRALADSFGKASVAIAAINEKLKEMKQAPLGALEVEAIQLKEDEIAIDDYEKKYQTEVKATNLAITDRIASLKLINAAIGEGYEATKKAAIETELMAKYGKEYFNASRAGDIAQTRGILNEQFDLTNVGQIKTTTNALNDQIVLEQRLLGVQDQSARVIERLTLQYRLEQLAKDKSVGATREQIDAEMKLFNLKKQVLDEAELVKLNRQIDATKELAAAELQGAEAVRKAGLENKYRDMAARGATPGEMVATRTLDELEHQKAVTHEALAAGMAHKNTLEQLLKERDALAQIKQGEVDVNVLAIARKENEKAILQAMIDQALALGTARDGIRAFFLQMQQESIKTGRILYDAMNSAVDGLAGNLAKLTTGQKSDFKRTFQDIARQMNEQFIKQGLEKGIGAIGAKLGIKPPPKKPIGTPNDRIYVSAIIEGSLGNYSTLPAAYPGGFPQRNPMQIPGLGGIGVPNEGGVFGGSMGGGIYSFAERNQSSDFFNAFGNFAGGFLSGMLGGGAEPQFGGYMAEGGTIEPGKYYIAGERGPEPIVPQAAATVIPNKAAGGGGGVNYYITQDNRGTDAALVEQRTMMGIQAAHNNAISTSVRAVIEQQKRSPQ